MKHEIKDNVYHLYDDFGKELMSIRLEAACGGEQVIIETPYEVYSGPIELVRFSDGLAER